MPKLVEVKLWNKLLSLLSTSYSNKDEKFMDTIKKKDPQLGRALDGWEDNFIDLLRATRKVQAKNGHDTTNIDKLITKFSGY